jgi:4-amino-4-deoxy-L-arabinose transferase-like glycosyltransferase
MIMSISPPNFSHRWLIIILLVSLSINTIGIGWGIPNKNDEWPVDSFNPVAAMAVTKRAFLDEPWNSGWFNRKYPLGHPIVLSTVQIPYLAWLRLTGEFHGPTSTYPYGFRDPDRALTGLPLLARLVSAIMGVTVVGLIYVIASTLFGTSAGLVAAVLATGTYPLVYYAHTANADMPLLFWLVLTVAATLAWADQNSNRAAALCGIAAGMALFTKEQSIGMLIVVPLVWFLRSRSARALEWHVAMKQIAVAGMGFMAVTVLIGNLWRNPAGFVNRWRFLLGVLPEEISERYDPLVLRNPAVFSFGAEIDNLLDWADMVTHALTVPVIILCLAGVVWTLWRHPRQAAIPLLLGVGYYLISLRTLGAVSAHYTMPLLFCLIILGGAIGGALLNRIQRLRNVRARQVATAGILAGMGLALLPGIEIDHLLINDPRYDAEAWLRANVLPGGRVEIYQPPKRLPRFSPDLQVSTVPLEKRTVELFLERGPEVVVLSSGGDAGLTGRRNPDWQLGDPLLNHSEPTKKFFNHLRQEKLGYHRVARFHTAPLWIAPRIGSLNPEITIFAPPQVHPEFIRATSK